jgi:hypothetical protein
LTPDTPAFGIDAGGEVARGVIFKAPFVALRVGVGDERTQKKWFVPFFFYGVPAALSQIE